MEDLLNKGWSSLRKDVQDGLNSVGLDFTPEPKLQPLKEILKAHLQGLLRQVKAAVENLVTPPKPEPADVTGQLKATVGELCQLSNKKQSLQRRVDSAKDQYKLLLEDFNQVQEASDREQKQLSKQSAVPRACRRRRLSLSPRQRRCWTRTRKSMC